MCIEVIHFKVTLRAWTARLTPMCYCAAAHKVPWKIDPFPWYNTHTLAHRPAGGYAKHPHLSCSRRKTITVAFSTKLSSISISQQSVHTNAEQQWKWKKLPLHSSSPTISDRIQMAHRTGAVLVCITVSSGMVIGRVILLITSARCATLSTWGHNGSHMIKKWTSS